MREVKVRRRQAARPAGRSGVAARGPVASSAARLVSHLLHTKSSAVTAATAPAAAAMCLRRAPPDTGAVPGSARSTASPPTRAHA